MIVDLAFPPKRWLRGAAEAVVSESCEALTRFLIDACKVGVQTTRLYAHPTIAFSVIHAQVVRSQEGANCLQQFFEVLPSTAPSGWCPSSQHQTAFRAAGRCKNTSILRARGGPRRQRWAASRQQRRPPKLTL